MSPAELSPTIHGRMSAEIIVSYDGTPNDDDALALGHALAAGGASLALAYVRHSREPDPGRERLAQHDAERRLEAGALRLGDPELPRHVLLSPSTPEGLEQLATAQGAHVIVFGSDYRTPPGRAEPGNTAQRLLEGGRTAVAVARAGLRVELGEPILRIAWAAPDGSAPVREAVEALAGRLGAQLVDAGANGRPDLIVVGSHADASPGRIALTGAARSLLNSARSSVLVLPGGAAAII